MFSIAEPWVAVHLSMTCAIPLGASGMMLLAFSSLGKACVLSLVSWWMISTESRTKSIPNFGYNGSLVLNLIVCATVSAYGFIIFFSHTTPCSILQCIVFVLYSFCQPMILIYVLTAAHTQAIYLSKTSSITYLEQHCIESKNMLRLWLICLISCCGTLVTTLGVSWIHDRLRHPTTGTTSGSDDSWYLIPGFFLVLTVFSGLYCNLKPNNI